ncbi:MAG TPA: Rho termination factor N-terminal domain-containing protein [Solirubrobacteraceae bacterium]|jgi:transcription termination factor Rho|nr:Rho termination factor N-terminal domain-containing protein [Solirubrobacteraceae bacterium]
MPVLDRSELEASPLADLHAIADQLGLDGFRRLRKADLVDAILGEPGGSRPDGAERADGAARADDDDGADREDGADRDDAAEGAEAGERSGGGSRTRRRRAPRTRRAGGKDDLDDSAEEDDEAASGSGDGSRGRRSRGARGGRGASAGERSGRRGERSDGEEEPADGESRIAEGVVELLGNGSAFLRVSPPDPSDEDVYISAAQVRRCELISGDRVAGPVRLPRRSERYPSLIRIDTINGADADEVSEGARYEDLPVEYPSERLALGGSDRTLEAIQWLTPLGRGSRALIVGAPRSGKTETLRMLQAALPAGEELDVTVVLAGVRPEEIAQWQEGPQPPAAALTFAASSDAQAQAVERALDGAKRVAARGGHALVLIDTLDGLSAHAARKALAAARKLRDGGSLTVIATATQPLGGETAVIALDVALTSTGRQPILDLVASGTLKPELLVGEDGAQAITKARAAALEADS